MRLTINKYICVLLHSLPPRARVDLISDHGLLTTAVPLLPALHVVAPGLHLGNDEPLPKVKPTPATPTPIDE